MSITRRIFLRNSALAVVGTAAVPSFLTRAAFGAVEAGDAQQASRRHLPARRCRWTEHRRPSRRAAVLRDAAQHQYPAQVGDRSQRLLRAASIACRHFSRCGSRTSRHRARRGIARHDAFSLRRAGFHGDRHARRESHRRWMAEPLAPRPSVFGAEICISRDCARAVAAAHSERLGARRRDE